MDTRDPHTPGRDVEPDDTAELQAALDELQKHARPIAELDPATEALKRRPDFLEAIEERRRIAEVEDPPAPEPVEIAADGPLLVQAEAAATYVAPVEVAPVSSEPKAPSGPVKIRGDVDPRRQPTVRVKTREAKGDAAKGDAASGEEPGEANGGVVADAARARAPEAAQGVAASAAREQVPEAAQGVAASAAPEGTTREGAAPEEVGRAGARDAGREERSSAGHALVAAAGTASQRTAAGRRARDEEEASSSARPRAGLGLKRGIAVGAVGTAIVFVAGAIAMLAGLRPPERPADTAASVTSPPPAPSVPASAVAASTRPVEAPAPTMAATSTATAAEAADAPPAMSAPSADATAPPVKSAPSVTLAPRTSGDPYADAAAPPSVKSAPSVAPVLTAAPSATPVVTASTAKAPPSVPYEEP